MIGRRVLVWLCDWSGNFGLVIGYWLVSRLCFMVVGILIKEIEDKRFVDENHYKYEGV